MHSEYNAIFGALLDSTDSEEGKKKIKKKESKSHSK